MIVKPTLYLPKVGFVFESSVNSYDSQTKLIPKIICTSLRVV